MPPQPKRDAAPSSSGSSPLLGSAPSRPSSRLAQFTFSHGRVLVVAAILALLLLGALLPYLVMPYVTTTIELAQLRATLFPASEFVGGLDPLWLPDYQPGPGNEDIRLGINALGFGMALQQVCLVVTVLTCGALFQNEINKFFWWPLHLSGWLLALSPVALFIGLQQLHSADVTVSLRIGWLPIALAGVLVLVATFQARKFIDTYASI
jgi:hypothetical protein